MPGRSRTPLADFPARRIALIKPSALGDIVHSLPVLTALRRRYPAAAITWVVNRSYEPLLRGHCDLTDTLPFDRKASRGGWWRAARYYGRFLAGLRRRRFDLVVDLQGLFRSGLMAAATGAARRVGLAAAREGAPWFYTDVVPVPHGNALHAVDRYWLVAEALGAGGGSKEFHVPIPEDARLWAERRLRDHPRPWLALGVGSRWPTKRWPPESFAALTRRAQQHFGGTALFVGGGDEAFLARAVRERLTGPVLDLMGQTSLPQLAALLARADGMLANDTGPMHLAAALGRPVVAPYTCTKVRLSGPYEAARGAVEADVPCQGSYLKRCGRMECMTVLTPEHLWPRLYEVLSSWESRSRSA
jgi:lipopolysaccharide heptosyltransferase I